MNEDQKMKKDKEKYFGPRGVVENVPMVMDGISKKPALFPYGKNNDGTTCYVFGRDNSIRVLQALKDAGFKIVVDDGDKTEMPWYDVLVEELEAEKIEDAKKLLEEKGYVVVPKEALAVMEIQTVVSREQLSYSNIDVMTYEKEYIAKSLGYELFRKGAVEETQEETSESIILHNKIIVLSPKFENN